MISRQKLIEAVKKEYYQFINYDTELTYNRAISDAIKVIESQPPADQWIPCSEKNPSKPGYYEVTVKDGMGCRIRTMARYDITIKDWVTSTIHDDEVVVAWREPLPEPYKGE